jgi:hypothetical protein
MMKTNRMIRIGAGCLMILSGVILGSTANAQDNRGQNQRQNGTRQMQGRMNRQGGPSAMAAAGDYIYIFRNNVLTQYSASDFKEVKKITFEAEKMPTQNNRNGQNGQGGPGGQGFEAPALQGDGQGDGQPPTGGQGGGQMGGMPPMQGMGMNVPGLAATTRFVYVLRGTTLMQISVSELKVTRKTTVEIDRQTRPAGQNGDTPPANPPQESTSMDMPQGDMGFQDQGQGQGPGQGQGRMQGMPGMGMMGGGTSLTATDKYVYVLGGTTVRIYNAETLELIKKVALATEKAKTE